MQNSQKTAVGAVFLAVACILGFFTIVTYSANTNPTIHHVFNLAYAFGIVSAAFLISGIWLTVSSRGAQK
jgi:uncharacterized membrane protein YphA (DoxX/SURF4 family)